MSSGGSVSYKNGDNFYSQTINKNNLNFLLSFIKKNYLSLDC